MSVVNVIATKFSLHRSVLPFILGFYNVLKPSEYKLFTHFQSVLILMLLNGLVFSILFSDISLLAYRNAIYFVY